MGSFPRWPFVALGMVLGMALAVPIAGQTRKQTKQAQKLLGKIKLVDGTGSGLDADKVQGMTPADIRAGVDADTLDGIDSLTFATRLHNVVTVSPAGGDFTAVQEAIDSITDSSFSNRYLVLVGPGTYAGRVTLKAGITVRGSGIGVTNLTAGPAGSCIDGYTVKGAAGATVTNLTIGNGASGACGVGILNAGVSFVTYRDVLISTAQSTNTVAVMNDNSEVELIDVAMEIGTGSGTGDAIGVDQANGSSLSARQSSIVGCSSGDDAYGIRNDDSSVSLSDSTVNVFSCGSTGDVVGILNINGAGSVTVDRSTVAGATNTIVTSIGYGTSVGASKLSGGPVSGTVTCVQVYDENYAPTTCP